jgi:acyl carrier protein
MEKEQITSAIRDILTRVLKHEKFEMNDLLTTTDVAGWDSLSHMVIIAEIEKHFKVRFKLKEINGLTNMGSLIALVKEKVS